MYRVRLELLAAHAEQVDPSIRSNRGQLRSERSERLATHALTVKGIGGVPCVDIAHEEPAGPRSKPSGSKGLPKS